MKCRFLGGLRKTATWEEWREEHAKTGSLVHLENLLRVGFFMKADRKEEKERLLLYFDYARNWQSEYSLGFDTRALKFWQYTNGPKKEEYISYKAWKLLCEHFFQTRRNQYSGPMTDHWEWILGDRGILEDLVSFFNTFNLTLVEKPKDVSLNWSKDFLSLLGEFIFGLRTFVDKENINKEVRFNLEWLQAKWLELWMLHRLEFELSGPLLNKLTTDSLDFLKKQVGVTKYDRREIVRLATSGHKGAELLLLAGEIKGLK